MQRTHRRGAAVCCTRGGASELAMRAPCRFLSSKMQIVIALACGSLLALAVSASRARAEPAGAGPLDLTEALEKAFAHNKDLAAFDFRITEQQGRLEQAGLLPNPQLDLIVEDAAGSGIYEGFKSSQTTLSLGWVLEGRVRAGRVRAARAGAELVSAEARILRIEVAADTAEYFLTSLASQARLERAEAAISLAEQTVDAVARRVQTGKAPTAELIRAEAELAMDRLSRDDVTHELAVAYHKLAAQWGETEPRFLRVEGDLMILPRVKSYAALNEGLERNPMFARYATEERLEKANLQLAEARRWPSLRPYLGVRRFEATNDTALVAGVSVPLSLFDRNQGQVAASRSAVLRSHAETDAARVRMQATLFALYEELEHFGHRAEMLRVEIIPRLAEASEETRRAYERGRYGYLELRSVQTDLLRAQSELLESSAGAHRLVIAIERLIGEQVVTN